MTVVVSMHCPALQEFVAMVTRYTRHLTSECFEVCTHRRWHLSTAYIIETVSFQKSNHYIATITLLAQYWNFKI